jgi:hypothetical protein
MATKLFLIAALSMLGVPAAAQTASDPVSSAPLHLGPLGLTPAIALENVGIDTNVFNEFENPKQDFTTTVRPRLDTALRLGRARLNVGGGLEAVYFRKYSSQSYGGWDGSAALEIVWNRLSTLVGGNVRNTRERPSFEVDIRPRHIDSTLTLGTTARVTGKTSVGVQAERRKIDYSASEQVSGSFLSETLNRDEARVTASLEHGLTPLTTIAFRANVQRDTFDSASVRDSQRVRLTPGVMFKPNALISGSAFVGYLRFDTLGASIPPFAGTFASVDLTYTLRGMTRSSVQSQRDVEYSFDPLRSYYVSTGVTGSVSQALGRSWSLTASAGRQLLDYQETLTNVAQPTGIEGNSRVNIYGARITYRLSPSIEFGVNADYYTRQAEVRVREYESLRAGGFLTYGPGRR